MSVFAIASLVLMILALAAMPSASVLLVVTRSAVNGIHSGLAAACGIVLGDLIFIALAIMGMSFLAETMGGFFVILKSIGGAYLVWVGIQLLRTNSTSHITQRQATAGLIGGFIAGLFLTLGDAMAILFYASLFPLFIDLTTVSTAGLVWIVALTIATVGGVKVAYALSARRLVTHLQRRNGLRYMPKAAGGILVGVGAYLLARHG